MRGLLRLHAGAPRGRARAAGRRGGTTRARRVFALAASTSVLATFVAAPARASAVTIRQECLGPANSVAVADNLLLNRYTLANFPTVTLPSNPTWTENPLKQVNWLFNYHSLRFVWALTTAWSQTGDQRYIDRAKFLLYDWQRDNPRIGSPSIWSWNDHATAWRAMVYVCAAEILPDYTWLMRTLRIHGETLASPSFYRAEGNHALNQDIALLEVGNALGRSDWERLAASRVAKLVTNSVDTSGVTNEQSVFYQLYNYDRYNAARKRLRELHQPVGSGFARIDLMPGFLAHATYPDGRYVPLGDTEANKATAIPGTWAQFAATQGAAGPKPSTTTRLYGAGYAFARTGWGETRPFADETMELPIYEELESLWFVAEGLRILTEAREAAQQRLDSLAILAGTAPAKGPGIVLTIRDPENRIGRPATMLLSGFGSACMMPSTAAALAAAPFKNERRSIV